MEALNFLRFWKHGHGVRKLNLTQTCNGNGGATTAAAAANEFDEDDDAFIDLEFPLRDSEDKGNAKNAEARCLSPNDHLSKRKILPIEPVSKPQSPVALLKSAQKFRVFHPKKTKAETPKHEKQGGGNHFTRENSLRRTDGEIDDSSKRLSKDLVHKYLNVIKPLYTKISKVGISGDSSMLSPADSPGNTRGVYKHLGKSKSSSAAASQINRRDDSLLLQHDGIQSAILHCKRSFNSSRESSWLSRCASDSSSQEKLSNASSTDFSLFSRATSNSARTSSEEHRL
ncbi:probable membrane-associated kinase regulator 5 isoform X2 [Hibiscus syriacus]|uniref:probable membrane-associated kinase regulator 5 isoform X2 n=1 Tax=Hibiscus syriacus TaxID=106335 RepID=UPI0019204776|nr:probable membrane-associated kinase regulator 5 isoform X2 [Hibiscus syriacus]